MTPSDFLKEIHNKETDRLGRLRKVQLMDLALSVPSVMAKSLGHNDLPPWCPGPSGLSLRPKSPQAAEGEGHAGRDHEDAGSCVAQGHRNEILAQQLHP